MMPAESDTPGASRTRGRQWRRCARRRDGVRAERRRAPSPYAPAAMAAHAELGGPQQRSRARSASDERGLGVVAEGRLELQDQYCASSKKRSVPLRASATSRRTSTAASSPANIPVQRSSVAGSAPAVVIAAMSPPERAEPWTVAAWPQFGSFTLLAESGRLIVFASTGRSSVLHGCRVGAPAKGVRCAFPSSFRPSTRPATSVAFVQDTFAQVPPDCRRGHRRRRRQRGCHRRGGEGTDRERRSCRVALPAPRAPQRPERRIAHGHPCGGPDHRDDGWRRGQNSARHIAAPRGLIRAAAGRRSSNGWRTARRAEGRKLQPRSAELDPRRRAQGRLPRYRLRHQGVLAPAFLRQPYFTTMHATCRRCSAWARGGPARSTTGHGCRRLKLQLAVVR